MISIWKRSDFYFSEYSVHCGYLSTYKYKIKIRFSDSLGYRFSIELPVLEGQEGHSQVSIINLGRNQILRIIDLKMSIFYTTYLPTYFIQNSIWFLLLLMYYLPKQLCRIERIFIFDLKNHYK